MENYFLVNALFSFALLCVGLMFLEGTFKGEGRAIKLFYNVDNLLFVSIKNKKLLKIGDQISFMICLTMSLLTLLNGVMSIYIPNTPNISAIFIFIGIILSWPIRILFIHIYKNRANSNLPRIWPFSKID
jgi:hypothetical protein